MAKKPIKIYITTYNNAEYLRKNLESLFGTFKNISDYLATIGEEMAQLKVTIINNHSNFSIPKEFEDKVRVWHNVTRPDFSCGHLARTWNSALIDGFRDLNDPDCDQVICTHDDVVWHNDWFASLSKVHETYDFYSGNYGCSFHSYLPSAVKTIGLWDERFVNIAYHEADYLLRALIYNKEKSSINDGFGGRDLNPTGVFFDHPSPNNDKRKAAGDSLPYHAISRKVFQAKWGIHPEKWGSTKAIENPPEKSLIKNFVFYPYFEKDVDDLEGKNYIVAWDFDNRWHDHSYTGDE
jgi:hypothetical protein